MNKSDQIAYQRKQAIIDKLQIEKNELAECLKLVMQDLSKCQHEKGNLTYLLSESKANELLQKLKYI